MSLTDQQGDVVQELEDRMLYQPCEQVQRSGAALACREGLRDVVDWCDVCLVSEVISIVRDGE